MTRFSVLIPALALLAAGCAPEVKTEAVQSLLEPMQKRLPLAGDTVVWDDDGTQFSRTVTKVSADSLIKEDSRGCAFTSGLGFEPSTSWTNCTPFTDGAQSYTTEGEIFPLAVGNTVRYQVDGSNANGDKWQNDVLCKVEGTARVTVPAGSFDTYHVRCEHQFTRRDYYVSPELGETMLFRRLRKSRNEVTTFRMVSFQPGQV